MSDKEEVLTSVNEIVRRNIALEAENAELKRQLKEETAQHACWVFNANALQKEYNELEAKIAELKRIIAELKNAQPVVDNMAADDLREQVAELKLSIAESQKQEPVAYWDGKYERLAWVETNNCVEPLFASPVIPEGMQRALLEARIDEFENSPKHNYCHLADLRKQLSELGE